MISISTLRNSQLEALKSAVVQGKRIDEFAEATAKFLSNAPVDGGADSDFITTTSHRIAVFGVWDHIPADVLVAAWQKVPLPAIKLFLEDAPRDLATKVLAALEPKIATKKKSRKEIYAGVVVNTGTRRAPHTDVLVVNRDVLTDSYSGDLLVHKKSGGGGLTIYGARIERSSRGVAKALLAATAKTDPNSGPNTKKRILGFAQKRGLERILDQIIHDDDDKPAKSGRHRVSSKSR